MREEALITPESMKRDIPCKPAQARFISQSKKCVRDILEGRDNRTLLIVGPCSIHDLKACKEYAIRLKELSEEVGSSFFMVMRSYFEKPRTTTGWKGLLYDPKLDGSHDIALGLRLCREFLLELAEMELPAATEFLDPITPCYYGDLISWGCIGARTSASQIHRQIASGLDIPIGFKNGTDGNLDVAVNGIHSASLPHTFVGIGDGGQASIVHTKGNPYAHLVLRGGVDGPNYDLKSVENAMDLLDKAGVPSRILIDCSHDNSGKQYERQIPVFKSTIRHIASGRQSIKGILLESHLFAGNQKIPEAHHLLQYAVSLTDPCLDWESTQQLIRWSHSVLQEQQAGQAPFAEEYAHR